MQQPPNLCMCLIPVSMASSASARPFQRRWVQCFRSEKNMANDCINSCQGNLPPNGISTAQEKDIGIQQNTDFKGKHTSISENSFRSRTQLEPQNPEKPSMNFYFSKMLTGCFASLETKTLAGQGCKPLPEGSFDSHVQSCIDGVIPPMTQPKTSLKVRMFKGNVILHSYKGVPYCWWKKSCTTWGV